jgi:hypothetical protein
MLAPMPAGGAADRRPFDTLHTLLSTARELVKSLSDDPELDRLVRAFRLFPERDREAILHVLEKDAAWRNIVERTDDVTGITVRPNPHASLYVHVLAQGADPLAADTADRDADVIRRGLRAFVQLLPLLFQEGVHAQWTAAAREIAGASGTDVRAYAVRLAREVEQLVAEIDAETEPS